MISKIVFVFLFIICLTPYISAPIALILGFSFSLFFENPYQTTTSKAINLLLRIAIIGLGFGMELYDTLKVGKEAVVLTFGTIVLVMILGYFFGTYLKVKNRISYLISAGTAICGGSAIAAVAPIIDADEKDMSISLGVVFLLNSIALLIFPLIGNFIELSQYQFGLWSATAIHDTSSVVGSAYAYGNESLAIATTVKLGRVLWIIPLSLISAFFYKKKGNKIKIPWFIGFFIAAIIINTYVPLESDLNDLINRVSKSLLVSSLFLVGTGLSIKNIKSAGASSLLLGGSIWVVVSVLSLLAINYFYL